MYSNFTLYETIEQNWRTSRREKNKVCRSFIMTNITVVVKKRKRKIYLNSSLLINALNLYTSDIYKFLTHFQNITTSRTTITSHAQYPKFNILS